VSRGKCFTWNKGKASSKKQKVKRGENGGSVRGVTREKRKEIRKQ